MSDLWWWKYGTSQPPQHLTFNVLTSATVTAPQKRQAHRSSYVMRLIAMPKCPYRPDRPMRCKYVSECFGKSKLMTTLTDWMSMPRVNKSNAHTHQLTSNSKTKNYEALHKYTGDTLYSNNIDSTHCKPLDMMTTPQFLHKSNVYLKKIIPTFPTNH